MPLALLGRVDGCVHGSDLPSRSCTVRDKDRVKVCSVCRVLFFDVAQGLGTRVLPVAHAFISSWRQVSCECDVTDDRNAC